ncbi:MAG TPA: transposase, partial [Solirubrobacteraceae bacterium]|nr:transposase [Solirubrobacteraceae bacterium]
HHGCPQRRDLMTRDGRRWLQEQALPETAREQVTVAVAMVDALDVQLAPIDRELRAYARRQKGCRALMAHYGIGELTAVTILAELGDCRRFGSSRHAVRYSGLTTSFVKGLGVFCRTGWSWSMSARSLSGTGC